MSTQTNGHHVNLVAHGAHSHPESYLLDALEAEFDDEVIWQYVDQCGCGGHVARAHHKSPVVRRVDRTTAHRVPTV